MALSNAYDIIIGRDSMRRYGASLNFDAANNDFISLSGGITLAALQVSEPTIGSYDIAVLNPNRYSDRDVNEDNAENISSFSSFSWADEMDAFTLQDEGVLLRRSHHSQLADTRLDLGGV
jgi:hypothetical protein